MSHTDTERQARALWFSGSEGIAAILRDLERSLATLRRIYDATDEVDDGRPTALGYIREQALAGLALTPEDMAAITGDGPAREPETFDAFLTRHEVGHDDALLDRIRTALTVDRHLALGWDEAEHRFGLYDERSRRFLIHGDADERPGDGLSSESLRAELLADAVRGIVDGVAAPAAEPPSEWTVTLDIHMLARLMADGLGPEWENRDDESRARWTRRAQRVARELAEAGGLNTIVRDQPPAAPTGAFADFNEFVRGLSLDDGAPFRIEPWQTSVLTGLLKPDQPDEAMVPVAEGLTEDRVDLAAAVRDAWEHEQRERRRRESRAAIARVFDVPGFLTGLTPSEVLVDEVKWGRCVACPGDGEGCCEFGAEPQVERLDGGLLSLGEVGRLAARIRLDIQRLKLHGLPEPVGVIVPKPAGVTHIWGLPVRFDPTMLPGTFRLEVPGDRS